MFLGSLSPSANLDQIINSYMYDRVKNSSLIIAGSGSDKNKLKKLANKSNIKFIDAPKDKVQGILETADVLLISLKDGIGRFNLPSKLLSYLNVSKPIFGIVNKNSAISKLIVSENCGWVIGSKNIKKVNKMFRKISNSDKLRLKVKGSNGQKLLKKKLSKESNLYSLVKIIEGIKRNEN